METLSSAEERRLLDGVKTAVDLVDHQGLTPNAALEKVARDNQWTRGHLRAAVSAFNNGRQVAQWNANEGILDKLAEFPLADYDQIHDGIWGAQAAEKQAADARGISPEYGLPPTFVRDPYQEMLRSRDLVKLAGDQAAPSLADPDPWTAPRKAWQAQQRQKRAFEEARSQFGRAHDNLRIRLKLLENYFQKAAFDRLAFPFVDNVVKTYWGLQGEALMDCLAAGCPREKRGSDMHYYTDRPVDLQAAPFTYVARAIEAAREVYRTKQALDEAAGSLEKAAEALRPFVETPSPKREGPISVSLFKEAGLAADATKGLLDEALGGKSKDKIQDLSLDLEDPDHENELRKIRTQAILANLMNDPESPISGHDPDEVLDAYNKVSNLAPRAAESPLALETVLGQKLNGHLAPFEIKDINDIEKGVQQTHGSPLGVGLLGNKPFEPSGGSFGGA